MSINPRLGLLKLNCSSHGFLDYITITSADANQIKLARRNRTHPAVSRSSYERRQCSWRAKDKESPTAPRERARAATNAMGQAGSVEQKAAIRDVVALKGGEKEAVLTALQTFCRMFPLEVCAFTG